MYIVQSHLPHAGRDRQEVESHETSAPLQPLWLATTSYELVLRLGGFHRRHIAWGWWNARRGRWLVQTLLECPALFTHRIGYFIRPPLDLSLYLVAGIAHLSHGTAQGPG